MRMLLIVTRSHFAHRLDLQSISPPPAATYVTVTGVITLRQDPYSGQWVPVLIPATNGRDVVWYI